METSRRLNEIPTYLFVELDKKKEAAARRGLRIIDLGMGDPDIPTPQPIVEAARKALGNPIHHQYPSGRGTLHFRQSIASWFGKRFGVELDPEKEITALIGSKEGISHLPLALVNPGETVLVPDPGYPPYKAASALAGIDALPVPLLEKNAFLPDIAAISREALKNSRLIFLNYPNNPTSASAQLPFFKKAVDWALRNNIWIAHDAAYSEIYFDEAGKPPSILQIPKAREIAIEFHSLSKTFSMTGWRIGWACGNPQAINALARVKENIDSGAFGAIQETAAWALSNGEPHPAAMRQAYGRRRSLFTGGLKNLGWKVFDSRYTFYVWTRTPQGYSSRSTCERLLEEAGLVATPGSGFGPSGEGYVRFSLTVPDKDLEEALNRLSQIRW